MYETFLQLQFGVEFGVWARMIPTEASTAPGVSFYPIAFFVCSMVPRGIGISHASYGWDLMNMGFNPLDKFRFLLVHWCGESAANELFALSHNIFCLS